MRVSDMVLLNFINEKGWELPDRYNCGPPDFNDEKHALDIVIDALAHTINMTKLNNVISIRVTGSNGDIIEFPKEKWCYWI